MLVSLLMVAGIAVIVGAKGFAANVAKTVAAIALGLALLTCLLRPLTDFSWPPEMGARVLGHRSALLATGFALLATLGFVAWSRRVERERARELWARRHGSARKRALPAAPPIDEERRS